MTKASRPRLQSLGQQCWSMFIAALLVCAAPAQALEVSVDGEQLTADLRQEPVADVLAAVARQTGAKLSIRGDLGSVRRQAFSRVPLAEALPRLVQPNGLILEFAPTPDATGGRRLVAIRAVAPGAPPGEGDGSSVRITRSSRNDPTRGAPPGFWSYEKGDVPLPPLEQRIEQLNKLTRQRGENATAALVYVLVADPEPAVRRSALGMLAGMSNPEAKAAITQAVADHDPEIRADSLRALARPGQSKPISLLAQAARGDADPRVRVAALDLLAGRDGEIVQMVLKGAINDADPDIREAAQRALRR